MPLNQLAESLNRGNLLIPLIQKHLLEKQKARTADKNLRYREVVEDADRSIECFKERRAEYVARIEQPLEGEYFHPSALGVCRRALWYDHFKAPRNESKAADDLIRSHFIFEMGTYFGVFFQNLLDEMGILESREAELVSKKHKLVGHADGILRIDGKRYLLEIKSMNPRRFSGLNAPETSHVLQATAYMKCLKLDACIFIYYNKDTSQLKEFLIPYTRENYCTVRSKVRGYFDSINTGHVPDREGDHPKVFPCSYCAYSMLCFDDLPAKKFEKKVLKQVAAAI